MSKKNRESIIKKNKSTQMSLVQCVIVLVIAVIIFFTLNYLFLVKISLRYFGTWFLTAISLFFGFAILSLFTKNDQYNEKFHQRGKYSKKVIVFITGIITFISLIVIYLVISLFGTPMFNANAYHKLIGEIHEPIQFTNDFDAVNTSDNLPIVDTNLAAKLGDKEFGKHGSLGSEFHVGEFHDLNVAGNLVAVAPLEYNGFFKWNNNKAGTPGYVIVDKFTGDVEIVTGLNLKYMPSAYFGTDLHRHVYYKGDHAKQYELIDFALELDDEMNPYWVITALKPTIGLSGGKQVMGVYVVNPKDGAITFYKPQDAPAWVDTIYPKDFVLKQLNKWGAYGDGFLNSFIGQKNVLQTTEGSRRVFNNGHVYYYTGLTSASADEATVGFVFINTRTKQVTRYSMSGATETAAMESAEGIVQNFGYKATFPIPMNVYNNATFFITLKDNKGLIKQYAFVNVSDFSKVGIGDTIDKAYSDYGEKLNIENVIDPSEDDLIEVRGIVKRISMSVVNGESQYEIFLDEGLYTARYKVSAYLSITESGDEVILKLLGDTVISFKNVDLEGE
ncbi:cell shape-determining protein [Mycoplasmatota bacterium]|nr:cell shape-determining protein [Mycoplasmatota bacterium]